MPTAKSRFEYAPGPVQIDFHSARGAATDLQQSARLLRSLGFDGADVQILNKEPVPFDYIVTVVGTSYAAVKGVMDKLSAARGRVGTFYIEIGGASRTNVSLLGARPQSGPRVVAGNGFSWITEIRLTFAQVVA